MRTTSSTEPVIGPSKKLHGVPPAAVVQTLAAAGYGAVAASGLDATNTPFPFLRQPFHETKEPKMPAHPAQYGRTVPVATDAPRR